jgi:hypothetical protein
MILGCNKGTPGVLNDTQNTVKDICQLQKTEDGIVDDLP